jgi:hypothetical protein
MVLVGTGLDALSPPKYQEGQFRGTDLFESKVAVMQPPSVGILLGRKKLLSDIDN